MDTKPLGRSGLRVSVVGLGCNNFGQRCDLAQTRAVVAKALDLGVTLFDTADVYGGGGVSEEYLGKALESRRADVVVATKFGMPMGEGPLRRGGSRRWVMQAAENSLRRLGTDHIDLYQIHFPDAGTPIEETLRALDDLVRQGKVRYVGCSNFSGWQVVEAAWTARSAGLAQFVSAQNFYNLLERNVERELVPACNAYGLGVLPYFPLASGLLTGKYQRGVAAPDGTRLAAPRFKGALTDKNFDKVEKLAAFAAEAGHSLLELAIGWLASQAHVPSVIAGATRPEQVEANVRAAAWKLSAAELAKVNEVAA
ncbi:MAG TPA: aldo/keto reductase [Myxococcota bacterium]|nr:aldo/keto reductase [Myxococcota bacterium]